MKYAVTHRTRYRYAEAVDLADHILHLSPRPLPFQRVKSAEIVCEPAPGRRSQRLDHFGNLVVQVSLEEPHPEFCITASCLIDVSFPPPPAPAETLPWELVRTLLGCDTPGCGVPGCLPEGHVLAAVLPDSPQAGRVLDRSEMVLAAEFTHASPLVPLLDAARDYALPSFPDGQPMMAGLRDLTRRIHQDFRFHPGATAISTPVSDVLRDRRGVCQDFAHVQIACLRALGLAARYVSGYLRTYPPPGEEKRVGADASHAWVSAWCPPYGWVDVDPTNDLVVADEHIVLAWGRDYSDVSPVRGVILGGGAHSLDVAVHMEELS